jgi:MarR family transcriptional regulator, 2-MHQ and catechol-resistance regulon repressor
VNVEDLALEATTPVETACGELFDLIDDERITLMGLLLEIHAKLTRVLSAALEEACGIPLTWFDVLLRLGRSPERRMTMSQLAAQVSLTTGGVTRLVDRIAEAGYVERQSCPSDRRSVFVALTAAGTDKLQEATATHLEDLERHLLEPLDADERAALASTLRKLRGEWGAR